MQKLGPSLAAAALMVYALAGAAHAAPPLGVYQCQRAAMVAGRVAIQPVAAGDFALLGRSTYAGRDGKHGNYTLGQDGMLSMITGPLKGSVYQQVAKDAFRLIRPQGSGEIDCAYNPELNPHQTPW